MKTIHILSESAAIGMRLRDILYQAGYTAEKVSNLSALSGEQQCDILIIYAKTRISDIMQNASDSGCPVILMLNPDYYAMYLDRARHAGIALLLMPVEPYKLLECVREASIS